MGVNSKKVGSTAREGAKAVSRACVLLDFERMLREERSAQDGV